MDQPPHLSHPPIIHNNNTMDTEFLVQMRQSNKCGSVRNDEIIDLHLGSGAGPWVSITCLLQDTSHIYWLNPPKQLTRKKERTQKWDSTSNKSYCTASSTYTESMAKRGRLGTQPYERQWQDQQAEIRQKNCRRKQTVSYSLDSNMDPST